MSGRGDYKRVDELAAWDMDKGCRKIVNQSTPARRRLRDKLRRQARKRIDRSMEYVQRDFEGGGD